MRYFLPFYHSVSNKQLSHIKHLYRTPTVDEFKKDLDFFMQNYELVDLDAFIDAAKNGFEHSGKPLLHLTFDDGLAECKSVIAPILTVRGIPATFFINSAFVDNKKLFFRFKSSLIIEKLLTRDCNPLAVKEILSLLKCNDLSQAKKQILNLKYHHNDLLDQIGQLLDLSFDEFLLTNRPYLSSDEIRLLHNEGFTIGSNSIDHPEFQYLSYQEQLTQVVESTQFLSSVINNKVKAFSFPFTDYGVSQSFFSELAEKTSIQITFGTAGMKHDSAPNNYQRVAMVGQLFGRSTIHLTKFTSTVLSFFYKNTIKRN